MAEALALVEHPFVHVSEVLPSPSLPSGQAGASDEEIAAWCADDVSVLVTTDSDFKGRWIRSGLLARHGVEVIVFNRDIPGLGNQHLRITTHLPAWQSELERQPYAYRVWVQNMSGGLKLRIGKKATPRRHGPVTF